MFVNTFDIVKFCWLAPVVFTSLCWRGFSTLKSYVLAVIFFLFFVIAYRVHYTTAAEEWRWLWSCG
jgi:hypothetical protein